MKGLYSVKRLVEVGIKPRKQQLRKKQEIIQCCALTTAQYAIALAYTAAGTIVIMVRKQAVTHSVVRCVTWLSKPEDEIRVMALSPRGEFGVIVTTGGRVYVLPIMGPIGTEREASKHIGFSTHDITFCGEYKALRKDARAVAWWETPEDNHIAIIGTSASSLVFIDLIEKVRCPVSVPMVPRAPIKTLLVVDKRQDETWLLVQSEKWCAEVTLWVPPDATEHGSPLRLYDGSLTAQSGTKLRWAPSSVSVSRVTTSKQAALLCVPSARSCDYFMEGDDANALQQFAIPAKTSMLVGTDRIAFVAAQALSKDRHVFSIISTLYNLPPLQTTELAEHESVLAMAPLDLTRDNQPNGCLFVTNQGVYECRLTMSPEDYCKKMLRAGITVDGVAAAFHVPYFTVYKDIADELFDKGLFDKSYDLYSQIISCQEAPEILAKFAHAGQFEAVAKLLVSLSMANPSGLPSRHRKLLTTLCVYSLILLHVKKAVVSGFHDMASAQSYHQHQLHQPLAGTTNARLSSQVHGSSRSPSNSVQTASNYVDEVRNFNFAHASLVDGGSTAQKVRESPIIREVVRSNRSSALACEEEQNPDDASDAGSSNRFEDPRTNHAATTSSSVVGRGEPQASMAAQHDSKASDAASSAVTMGNAFGSMMSSRQGSQSKFLVRKGSAVMSIPGTEASKQEHGHAIVADKILDSVHDSLLAYLRNNSDFDMEKVQQLLLQFHLSKELFESAHAHKQVARVLYHPDLSHIAPLAHNVVSFLMKHDYMDLLCQNPTFLSMVSLDEAVRILVARTVQVEDCAQFVHQRISALSNQSLLLLLHYLNPSSPAMHHYIRTGQRLVSHHHMMPTHYSELALSSFEESGQHTGRPSLRGEKRRKAANTRSAKASRLTDDSGASGTRSVLDSGDKHFVIHTYFKLLIEHNRRLRISMLQSSSSSVSLSPSSLSSQSLSERESQLHRPSVASSHDAVARGRHDPIASKDVERLAPFFSQAAYKVPRESSPSKEGSSEKEVAESNGGTCRADVLASNQTVVLDILAGNFRAIEHATRGKISLDPDSVKKVRKRFNIHCNDTILASGIQHTACIINGDLYTWGKASGGRLGQGDIQEALGRALPMRIETLHMLGIKVKGVSCGAEHAVARTTKGVFSWGENDLGQLGLGHSMRRMKPDNIVTLNDTPVETVVCGLFHTFVISGTEVYGWGANRMGQLGLNHTENMLVPTQLAGFSALNLTAISAGATHTACLTEEGHVYTCGGGIFGQLLQPKFITRQLQLRRASNVEKKVVLLACGPFQTAVVTDTNEVMVGGRSCYEHRRLPGDIKSLKSQRDDRENAPFFPLVQVDVPHNFGKIDQVALSHHHIIIKSKMGKVASMGSGLHGVLGHGSLDSLSSFRIVSALKVPILSVSCGETFSVALDANGGVWTWGRGDTGELGTDSDHGDVLHPKPLDILVMDFSRSGRTSSAPLGVISENDDGGAEDGANCDDSAPETSVARQHPDSITLGERVNLHDFSSARFPFAGWCLPVTLVKLAGAFNPTYVMGLCRDMGDFHSLAVVHALLGNYSQSLRLLLHAFAEHLRHFPAKPSSLQSQAVWQHTVARETSLAGVHPVAQNHISGTQTPQVTSVGMESNTNSTTSLMGSVHESQPSKHAGITSPTKRATTAAENGGESTPRAFFNASLSKYGVGNGARAVNATNADKIRHGGDSLGVDQLEVVRAIKEDYVKSIVLRFVALCEKRMEVVARDARPPQASTTSDAADVGRVVQRELMRLLSVTGRFYEREGLPVGSFQSLLVEACAHHPGVLMKLVIQAHELHRPQLADESLSAEEASSPRERGSSEDDAHQTGEGEAEGLRAAALKPNTAQEETTFEDFVPPPGSTHHTVLHTEGKSHQTPLAMGSGESELWHLPSRIFLSLSPEFLLKESVATFLRAAEEHRAQLKPPLEALWKNIKANISTDIPSHLQHIRLQHVAVASRDSLNQSMSGEMHKTMYFTCGHSFPVDDFVAKILPEFVKRVQGISQELHAWATVIRALYLQDTPPLACPACCFSLVRQHCLESPKFRSESIEPWASSSILKH